jgi:hypothetical protein
VLRATASYMPEAQATIVDEHRMILLNARVPQAMLDDLDAIDGIDAPRSRSALVRPWRSRRTDRSRASGSHHDPKPTFPALPPIGVPYVVSASGWYSQDMRWL